MKADWRHRWARTNLPKLIGWLDRLTEEAAA